jgi:hypothetical protein
MVGRIAGLALAALALVPPGADAAAPDARRVADDVFSTRSDGGRYFAYAETNGRITVLGGDTPIHVDAPAPCSIPDGHRGTFLVTCARNSANIPNLLDAASGTLTEIPGMGMTYNPGYDEFGELGTHWLAGVTAESGQLRVLYLNRQTGERRLAEAASSRPVLRDLDSPELARVRPQPPADRLFIRRGSYIVTSQRARRSPDALVLRRSGERTRILSRCARRLDCSSVSVSSRFVTWAEGSTGYAFSLRTAHTSFWRFRSAQSAVRFNIAQTRTRLFFQVPTGRAMSRLYRSPLPR